MGTVSQSDKLLSTHTPNVAFRHLLPLSTVKLQALVYDILPSTTAVFSYAIWSRKLSANEQGFLGFFLVLSQ